MHYKQLTKDERYQIKACLQINMKQVAIAKLLKRSLATITKEIKHNTGKKGYRSKQASDLATARRLTAKKHIKLTPEIRQDIVKLIKQELSPEQVCDYLEAQGKTKFHHETIYRLLLEDKHVGGTLYKHLRHLHKSHRKRYGSYERRGRIKNVVSIKQRPSVVDSRSRIGDWENDTVISKNKKSAIYTLVDRKILYTIIVKLNSKNATELAGKTLKVLEPMPSKIHTVTYDNYNTPTN